MTQPPQESCFDGFAVPSPNVMQKNDAADELVSRLKSGGWTFGDNTAVLTLTATADIDHQRNLPTHITIAYDDIAAFGGKLLQIGVEGLDEAFKQFIKGVKYHVTVAEADERYDKNNPRWFSDTSTWSPSSLDQKSRGLTDAVAEAKTKLHR